MAIQIDVRTKEKSTERQRLVPYLSGITPLYNIPALKNKQKSCFICICPTLVGHVMKAGEEFGL